MNKSFTSFSQVRHTSVTDCPRPDASLAATKQASEGVPLKSRQWLAVAAAGMLAIGASACGSSSSSDTGSSSAAPASTSGGSSAGGTLNGAGSTLAQPIYQQWGSELKGQNITLNYQGVGSGAGVASFAAGTADFAASDPALTPEDVATIKKSPPLQFPTVFGAITVSYNLSGVKAGLKLDGADHRRHLPRQGQEVERPGDREPELGPLASGHQHHGGAPLRLVGHDEGLHHLPRAPTARSGSQRSAPTRT